MIHLAGIVLAGALAGILLVINLEILAGMVLGLFLLYLAWFVTDGLWTMLDQALYKNKHNLGE